MHPTQIEDWKEREGKATNFSFEWAKKVNTQWEEEIDRPVELRLESKKLERPVEDWSCDSEGAEQTERNEEREEERGGYCSGGYLNYPSLSK